ncbi:MAG: 3-oxoacyl-ACP reductase, partial [Acidimicrobiia bacterium]|nr:3-oxoacyl-ACP reductase [Acidimicrobiia bacterium]
RLGTPDEVAGVIVFLAAEAHYMTGAIVDVGGGR